MKTNNQKLNNNNKKKTSRFESEEKSSATNLSTSLPPRTVVKTTTTATRPRIITTIQKSGNTNNDLTKDDDNDSDVTSFTDLHKDTISRSTNDDIWMEIVTPTIFGKFQKQIFNIIQKIVEEPIYHNHPFILRWNNLVHSSNKSPLSEAISFCHLKLCLKIEDLMSYKKLLQQCPELDHYIIM